MNQLLEIREYLKRFYGKYELYIVPAIKFVFALAVFVMLNSRLGYMGKIAKLPIALILSLLCSFLPANFIVIVAAALALAHVYALSLEAAAIVGALFIVMFLLYFRFSPKDAYIVLITPICCFLKIPYVVPISVGLLGTPGSSVSTGCGVAVYFILAYVREISSSLSSLDAGDTTSKFKYIIDGIVGNKGMIVMMCAFVATTLIVYYVKKMNIDHAWTIAIIVGALTDVLVLLVGDLIFTTNLSVFGVLLGTVLSVGVAVLIKFFAFNLDYARTERVQFEDDDYYYYVKAVPKVMVATSDKKVKKVSGTDRSDAENVTPRRTSAAAEGAGAGSLRRSSSEAVRKSTAGQGTVREGAAPARRPAGDGTSTARRPAGDGTSTVRRTVGDSAATARRPLGENTPVRRTPGEAGTVRRTTVDPTARRTVSGNVGDTNPAAGRYFTSDGSVIRKSTSTGDKEQ
ncbi:MAG: hypothetical protein MJ119_07215 [Lachnospiraceae bacterium]|nr:hypothetical protein [Lachnospiraceae bacterium]